MQLPLIARAAVAYCAALAAIFSVTPPRSAAQSQNVWKANNAANVNWSDQNNWTAQVIATGQLAVFSSNSARFFNTVNDISNLTVAGIIVNANNTSANPITVGGNAFGVSGSGVDLSAAATDLIVNTAGLTLAANQTWTTAAGRMVTINTTLTGGGTAALTVAGAGTVRLNGNGSGLANIQVTGGTLLLGSATQTIGSGPVTVSGTGTLAGIGTIVPNTGGIATNRVTVGAGTTLAPGIGGVGTLTVGSSAVHGTAELDGGGTFAVDLGSAVPRPVTGIADVNTNDRLTVNGNLQFATGGSNLNLDVNGAGVSFSAGRTYDYFLASGSDALTGFNPAQFTITPLNFSLPGTFVVQSVNSSVVLSYAPVPEPGLPLLAIAVAAGIKMSLRRRQ